MIGRRGIRWVFVGCVLAGMTGSCVSASKSPLSSSFSSGTGGTGAVGLSSRDLDDFYHLPQGSEHMWLAVLRALPSQDSLEGRVEGFQSFLDNPERFGLLPNPSNREGIPVGLALVPASKERPYAKVGFTCSACHVAEFHYRGGTVRVDGAPSLLSLEGFNKEGATVVHRTLSDPKLLMEFLVRLSEHLPLPPERGSEEARLQAAYPDSDLTPDGNASARQKLEREVTRYLQFQQLQAQAAGLTPPEPRKEPLSQEQARELARKQEEECAKQDPSTVETQPLPSNLPLVEYFNETSRKQVRTVPDAIKLLRGHLLYLTRLGPLTKCATAGGPGRTDAFGVARALLFPTKRVRLNAPVSFPSLWEFRSEPWLHWDGNSNSIMQRNIGQALGVGALIDFSTYDSSVLPLNLARLEELSRGMGAPKWPAAVFGSLDTARVARGEPLFAEHCGSCHVAGNSRVVPVEEVGTDDIRARNFAQKVDGWSFPKALGELLEKVEDRAFAREGLAPEQIRKLEPEGVEWLGPGGYVARPLAGVWATAPYLHNGSVPTLWDLLQPAAERPRRFLVGLQEFDPGQVGYVSQASGAPTDPGFGRLPTGERVFVFDVEKTGNRNIGHEYGSGLTREQKLDLLEYLKSL
jgi:hypothetical protein